jgi:4-diphosphocytidyl-2-C-methyl-D-erythritol kinase
VTGGRTTRVTIRAQAKLNLWLHVLAREASGHHGIETLFHRIELADDLSVELADSHERSTWCSEDVGPAHDNLAYRAAELYCTETGWPTGFRIGITKNIPARGGLGGGSADAAATLIALNAMSPHELSEADLADIGGRLGADVPFLLTRAPAALAWAHGDRMLELPALPQRHVALVLPDFGISTADAYQSFAPADRRHGGQLSIGDLSSWDRVADLSRNDLSRSAAAERSPSLAAGTAALRAAGAVMAGMTGSGSVLFGIFESAPDKTALERTTGYPVVLTRTAVNVEAVHRLE